MSDIIERLSKLLTITYAIIAASIFVRGLLGIDVSGSTLATWVGGLGIHCAIDYWYNQ